MTHPSADPAAKALADFWRDMGVEDAAPFDASAEAGSRRDSSRRERVASPAGADAAARGSSGRAAPAVGAPRTRPEPRRLAGNPIFEAQKLAAGASDLPSLKRAVEAFEGCPLKQAARTTVVFDGVQKAPVMLVGEAPGAEEDAQGLPFVGRAGKLLDRMLGAVGLSRTSNVFITNCIYWRPPGNRDPNPAEMQICAPFLARQIELNAPRLLLTTGKFATQALLKVDDGIMRLRGKRLWFKQDGLAQPIACIPILHPAYLLRQPQEKAKAWDDLLAIAAVCDELGVARGPNL